MTFKVVNIDSEAAVAELGVGKMAGNDWNNLGRDVKDIVQHALDTGDFGALNRDLGVTLENALGNVAQSMKNAARTGMGDRTRYKYNQSGEPPFGTDSFQQEENTGTYENGSSTSHHGNYSYNYNYDYNYRPYGNYRSSSSRRIREAREEFALFVNTGGAKAAGITFTVLGIIFASVFGILAGAFGIVGAFVDAFTDIQAIGLPIGFGIAATAGAVMGIGGNNLRKKVKRFRSYVKTLNGKTYASIKDLAKSVGKSEKFVRRDLKKMIDKRMFLEGHLDKNGTCLIASDEAYEQYMETEKNIQEMKEKEAQTPKTQLSEEVKKVIAEGERYVEEIRRSNDAIPGIEISNKMYHLENVIRRIFQRVEQHPELINDLHKFMDYYLPTTMKLLNAYEELDRQDLEGENIKTAKQEIENTLDTINVAFENLLDSFYKETAWDVSSDISVLKTMLAQEGLTGKQDFQGKE